MYISTKYGIAKRIILDNVMLDNSYFLIEPNTYLEFLS